MATKAAVARPLVSAKTFNTYQLIFLAAIFFVITGNSTFFEQVLEVYPWDGNAAFVASLAILLGSVFVVVGAFFSLIIPVRVVITFLILVTAITGYFADQFGTVIDIDMIRNALETNTSEFGDLMTLGLMFRLCLLAILPIALLWLIPYRKTRWIRESFLIALTGTTALGIIIGSVLVFGTHYSSFFREHKPIRFYSNPSYPIYSAAKYVSLLFSDPKDAEYQLLKTSTALENDEHHELVILVVGESARADHFSVNGYAKNTNPNLTNQTSLISYSDIDACGTSTAISVPCMFSYSGRDEFSVATAKYTENILDLLDRSGVNVLWRDNNSSSKDVANRINYQQFSNPDTNTICDVECRDVGMLVGLQEYIEAQDGDILIVLHQMGSHGPAYYKRYPAEVEQFTPACHSAELSECSQEEITNAYDNTIFYTDYFLSRVIDLLKVNTPKHETAMFYIADHGESLGEGGVFLHGMPYNFAPDAQTKVPLLVWVGESSDISYEKSLLLKDVPNSHDMIFSTLLEIFEVQTELLIAAKKPLVTLIDDLI